MRKLVHGIGAAIVAGLLTGCALIVQPPNDEELTLRLLRDYEAAVAVGVGGKPNPMPRRSYWITRAYVRS